jgi:flagellar basal body-associated protein FliL
MAKAKGDYTILIPVVLFVALAGVVAYSIIKGNKGVAAASPAASTPNVQVGNIDTSKLV